MGGKASLLLVLGFTLIFMVAGRSFNSMASGTTGNMMKYYNGTKARYLATSGINMVANMIFTNPAMNDTTCRFNIDGGRVDVALSPEPGTTLVRRLVATAAFADTSSVIKVLFRPSKFSKYAYFSIDENSVNWATGDTVWGPFHTNDDMTIKGYPVFFGKVTCAGRQIVSYGKAKYLGGYQKVPLQQLPADGVTKVKDVVTPSAKFTGQNTVYLDFRGDSIRYRFSTSGPYTYVLASTFAPNGVIYCDNAEVHITANTGAGGTSGIGVKGKYTIAASGLTGSKGNIYLDNDILYNRDPTVHPASSDMLGIVAERNVIVKDNSSIGKYSETIQASIYAQTGSFTAENYTSKSHVGTLKLLGGIIQDERGAVGTIGSSGNVATGYSKRYRYDNRLMDDFPPAFPGCGSYEIVSWFE